jgi:hypothetical protein
MTILTTATNLEELLESKPTARGQVLSRFMGLEFLKKKEESAKEIYSDYSKSMLSNIYNTEQLKNDNIQYEEDVVTLQTEIGELTTQLGEVDTNLIKGKDYRDDMLKKKHTNIDKEISMTNPVKVQEDIDSLEYQKTDIVKKLDEIKVVEPSSYYHEDDHDKVKDEYNVVYKEKVQIEAQINEIEKLKSSVSGGIMCQHCGIDLMNASITQSKIAELDGYIMHKDQKEGLMKDLSGKEQGFVQLKKEFDEYEKNKLIKEKYELSIEGFDLKIGNLKDKLVKYSELQDKIKENEKIETLLIKAGMRIEELEREKTQKQSSINNNTYKITSLGEKIKTNLNKIIKIKNNNNKKLLDFGIFRLNLKNMLKILTFIF